MYMCLLYYYQRDREIEFARVHRVERRSPTGPGTPDEFQCKLNLMKNSIKSAAVTQSRRRRRFAPESASLRLLPRVLRWLLLLAAAGCWAAGCWLVDLWQTCV